MDDQICKKNKNQVKLLAKRLLLFCVLFSFCNVTHSQIAIDSAYHAKFKPFIFFIHKSSTDYKEHIIFLDNGTFIHEIGYGCIIARNWSKTEGNYKIKKRKIVLFKENKKYKTLRIKSRYELIDYNYLLIKKGLIINYAH